MMAVCPASQNCNFYASVESSLVKRVRYASAYPYCKGGKHEHCAIHVRMTEGREVPGDLLPDGGVGDFAEGPASQAAVTSGSRFLVVDDSPVFAALAANAIRQHMPSVDVSVCSSFEEAEPLLRAGGVRLVVSGYGVGGGKTVLDVRRITGVPILVFTGRMGDGFELPSRSKVVHKGAGPDALRGAIDALLAS